MHRLIHNKICSMKVWLCPRSSNGNDSVSRPILIVEQWGRKFLLLSCVNEGWRQRKFAKWFFHVLKVTWIEDEQCPWKRGAHSHSIVQWQNSSMWKDFSFEKDLFSFTESFFLFIHWEFDCFLVGRKTRLSFVRTLIKQWLQWFSVVNVHFTFFNILLLSSAKVDLIDWWHHHFIVVKGENNIEMMRKFSSTLHHCDTLKVRPYEHFHCSEMKNVSLYRK